MPSNVNKQRLLIYLSQERFTRYLRAANHDLDSADALYRWNIAISGAFYEVLAAVEIPLRNALHDALTSWHGDRRGYWYDDPRNVLSARSRADIQTARERINRRGRTETPGRILAELSIGFWRFLLSRTHEGSLWTPHLRHAFPYLQPQARRTVHNALSDINVLRNRIAHHESIFSRDLSQDHARIIALIGWIDPTLVDWMRTISRVEQVRAKRPC